MSYYNVIFTILPPLVIGIFDQFVSARMLDRYPQLYHLGQQNYFFTPIRFFYWVGNAFYHSIVSKELRITTSGLILYCALASLCLLRPGFLQRLTCHRWKKLWLMGVGHYSVSGGVANCLGQSSPDLRVCPFMWIDSRALIVDVHLSVWTKYTLAGTFIWRLPATC